MNLLPPKRYLPIRQAYRLPGPLFMLGDPEAGSRRIEVDRELEAYRSAKGSSRGQWASPDAREQFEQPLRHWLIDLVHDDQPGLLSGADLSLDELAALIQEDLVLMHRSGPEQPAARSQAIYMNVSFPSGWCPDCLLGMSFLSIHAGVPVADEFDGAARVAAAEALFAPGNKVRFVWGLAPDDRLDRRVCHRVGSGRSAHRSLVANWNETAVPWLRVERQVICPLDEQTSVFLIRVYRYEWSSLDEAVQESARQAIESMPASIQAYKGLSGVSVLA